MTSLIYQNCRSKSTQHYIVDQRRMICETCQNIPISTINDDISAFECQCSTPDNMWICQSCTNTHTPQIFRLKTESRGQVASRQCHRGLDCYGTGWCEISTRWAYQIGASLYDAYSIDPRYLTVRSNPPDNICLIKLCLTLLFYLNGGLASPHSLWFLQWIHLWLTGKGLIKV